MNTFQVEVSGTAEKPFEALAHIFARAVGAQRDGGAQLAVYHRGQKVVDLVGGEFAHDSLTVTFSVSKAISAIATHICIAQKTLRLEQPLHESWPQFERSARARAITLDHVLTHSSGLPSVDRVLTMDEHVAGELENELERQEPYWDPGTAYGYHSITWGTLLDGLYRRALGVDVAEVIRTKIAEPLGLDLSLGATEQQLPRVRPLHRPALAVTPLERSLQSLPGGTPDGAGKLIWPDMTLFNRHDVLRRHWPASNVIAGARDIAKALAATLTDIDGVRLLDDAALEQMTRRRFAGVDRVLGIPIAFGTGVQLPFPQFPMLGSGSFGHEGAGGAVCVADPHRQLALAYISDSFPTSNGAAQPTFGLVAAVALLADEAESHDF